MIYKVFIVFITIIATNYDNKFASLLVKVHGLD